MIFPGNKFIQQQEVVLHTGSIALALTTLIPPSKTTLCREKNYSTVHNGFFLMSPTEQIASWQNKPVSMRWGQIFRRVPAERSLKSVNRWSRRTHIFPWVQELYRCILLSPGTKVRKYLLLESMTSKRLSIENFGLFTFGFPTKGNMYCFKSSWVDYFAVSFISINSCTTWIPVSIIT